MSVYWEDPFSVLHGRTLLNLQALVITTIISGGGGREKSKRVMNMCPWEGLVTVSPEFQIPACEFFRHQRIELERWTKASSNLFEIFYLEHGGRGTVEFKHLDRGLEDMLS